MRLFTVATSLAALGLISSAAAADEKNVEVGIFAGYHFYDDDNDLGDISANAPLDDSLIIGARGSYGFHRWVVGELEFGYLPTDSQTSGENYNVLDFRAHALVPLFTGKFQPFALAGLGVQVGLPDSGDSDTDTSLHMGIGAKYLVTDRIGVRADARVIYVPAQGDGIGTDFELSAGAYWRFGAGEAAQQVSKVIRDRDGDGIEGSADKCPTEKEDEDGFEDDDGCPDPDNDGDGVADGDDQCPRQAGVQENSEGKAGCPETDADGDGIEGAADKCPTEKEDKDGFQDDDGCPDPDNDGDGVADADDKCEGEKETRNGYQDSDGCPDTVPKAIAKFTGTIRGITFENNSSTIRSSSYGVLNRAVTVLKKYPSLRIEVGGHTDSRGRDARNRELSELRAQAVRAYLVSKGVAESRVTAKGFGSERGIASNDTSSGRAKNRRVEFTLIK